jgi:hypothetical protein
MKAVRCEECGVWCDEVDDNDLVKEFETNFPGETIKLPDMVFLCDDCYDEALATLENINND